MAEQKHPRLFNSFVNHISDNDLTHVEYAAKVEDTQLPVEEQAVSVKTLDPAKEEVSLSQVFNVVTSPDKKS